MSLLCPLFTVLLLLWPVCSAFAAANGGVSLNQTRVIFAAGDKAQTLTVKNTGSQNYLIQSRIQRDLQGQGAAPFIVTPPLFPLGPKSKQLLRILKQGEALPTDRESLFYLSVLAIPAHTEPASGDARLSMGFEFTIKLLYRPQGLKIATQDARCQLQFSRTPNGIRAENPTPYFLTFGSLAFDHDALDLNTLPSMIAPMSAETFPASRPVARVHWQALTDAGDLSPSCQQTLLSQ
ncbi:molecular chaperone [Serratia fonticola]|jgi:fimbrial chaperone protein|uniref:Molecular chaperone n=1 Tax=Serratia fonticola TaxID=47917 RepID=A0AAE7JSI9_SERFO|nr:MULTISPECIES: molecular chaperone [Serratia]MCO7507868.1 molecular chaperone [Serratia fonticola]OCJ36930.1 pilus assembly protein PapD [Serratia sp. 14-2641]QKJ57603.1 molecular chaperone [Serratia fonticola]